ENGARKGPTGRLNSSRYSEECKEKTKGKKPQQGQIESHFSPRPKRHRSPNKPSTSPPSNLNRDASPSLRTIEIPTIRHITGKSTCKPVYAIGFRNRLLATLYQCCRSLSRYGLPRPQQDSLHLCGDRETRFRSRRANEILQECTCPAVGDRPERFVRTGDFGDRQPVFPRNHSWIPGCRMGSWVRRPS